MLPQHLGCLPPAAAADKDEDEDAVDDDDDDGCGGGDGSDGASCVDVFWAVPQQGRIIQWSDSKMLGFGDAVVIFDDFLRGSSGECEAFGSTPLSAAGLEFVIRDFECWQVGTSP
mmetsp:Transcript_67899/g.176383  ORF Transcript_67899/g.176383 Transcript_67899/m.176383 type:complete len:115 (+) Transcript_67899:377-721(+)